jgi:hypothetical protein
MATKTVVCPECDSPLAPGRFSCSVCGALVASVATMSRSFAPGVEPVTPSDHAPAAPAVAQAVAWPAEVASPAVAYVEAAQAAAQVATAPIPQPSAPAPGPVRKPRAPALPRRPKAPGVADAASAGNGSAAPEDPPAPIAEQSLPSWAVAEPAPVTQAAPAPVAPPTPAAAPSWPDRPAWPPVRTIDAVAPPVEPSAARVPAGSYLPPSAVLPPAEALPLPGAARATVSDAADATSSTGRRMRLGEGAGPLGLPIDVATRIVLLGAGISLLGFLLPWADIVIGSGVMDGYVAQWGLAGPGHPVILLLVAALFAMTLLVERLPRWARLGLPSIGLACLLIGLAWPYLAGPFDAAIGVYVVAIGAVVMIAGGLLDRIASRHAEPVGSV